MASASSSGLCPRSRALRWCCSSPAPGISSPAAPPPFAASRPAGPSVLLFFPSNGGFPAARVDRFRGIVADGTGLVALSYRGYAGSTGHPSEQGLLLDAAATYAFTTAR